MKWLQIHDLINFRISCLSHQVIHTKKPFYLYEIFITNNIVNTRNNIGFKLGTKPKHIGKSQYTKNQFCSRAYDIYNVLPGSITSIIDKNIFKIYLKKFFFNNDDLPDPKKFKTAGLMDGL